VYKDGEWGVGLGIRRMRNYNCIWGEGGREGDKVAHKTTSPSDWF